MAQASGLPLPARVVVAGTLALGSMLGPPLHALEWEPAQAATDAEAGRAPIWELVPPHELINPTETSEPPVFQPPTSLDEAKALRDSFWPNAADYIPPTRLGQKVPTAFILPEGEVLFSAYQLSPLAGGGDAGGSGNQNFAAQLDLAITKRLQISGFFTDSDDPLFSQPEGLSPNPANIWRTWGLAGQWQLVDEPSWGLALSGSIENFFVESGGCRSSSRGVCSPNIFNGLRKEVSTNNLVGSLALPISWRPSRQLELSFSPGVSMLPSSQGAGQGGAGTFFGTNITLTAGALWQATPQLGLYGSIMAPLGPGTNSFNSNLEFSRVPILSGGVRYALNPRIGFELALTNGFGASPATSVLTLPSSNQMLWMAQWSYLPGAMDSPAIAFTPRSRSLSLGGITVGTAVIPPANTANTWLSADNKGSMFGQVAYSISNDFQLFYGANIFEQVNTANAFAANYVGQSGVFGNRAGGKAVFFHQQRGAPFSLAGSASFGQDAISGYLYGDLIATWQANQWLAFNLNPKFVWAGNGQPFSIGISANLQLGDSFQLLPEVNIAANSTAGTNATLALRWLARRNTAIDVYVTNAAGQIDVGQLLQNVDQTRFGARLTLQF